MIFFYIKTAFYESCFEHFVQIFAICCCMVQLLVVLE